MQKLFFLLTLFFALGATAQLTQDNANVLRKELLRLVNALRAENGAGALEADAKLQEAATLHSRYMVRKQVLSHEETGALKDPEGRVKRAKGKEFELIGENILVSAPQVFPLKTKDVRALAEKLFLQWKNSPEHYKNMLNPEYTFTDFGFETDKKTKRIYATQVLARKGVEIPGQLSKNAFGVRKGSKAECGELIDNKENILVNIGNGVAVEGDQVVLYYHNLETVKRVIQRPNDGIAVDLVFDSQLACGQPNQLDLSPVYDGVMLKPVYRDALFAGNTAKSNYRFIAPIGTVPAQFREQVFSVSMILIQNGMECAYHFPIEIAEKSYPLNPVEPVLLEPNAEALSRSGIVRSIEIPFDFRRNATSSLNEADLPKIAGTVEAVDVVSYSSVEGKTSDNEKLHTERAQFILRELEQRYRFAKSTVTVNTMENWPKMRFQLKYFDMDSLSRLPNDSIKAYLATHQSAFFDSLLFEQRRSTAILHVRGQAAADWADEQIFDLNLRTAIVEKNDLLANRALYRLYQLDTTDLEAVFEPVVFHALKTNPLLVQNAAAVLVKHPDALLYERTEFLFGWMDRLSELTPDARHNLVNLYAQTALQLINEWDVSAQRLAKVIHPDAFYETANNLKNQTLLLNFHLAAIEYFGQINDTPLIQRSFAFIAGHFKKEKLSPQEETDLALFFNYWSQYRMSSELLFAHIGNADFSEEQAFTLLTSAFLYDDLFTDEQLEQIMERAYAFNQERWCAYVSRNYQLLREDFVKNTACRFCAE